MELEDLRHEKEMQREEIQKLMGQIHQLRSELQVRFLTVHFRDSHLPPAINRGAGFCILGEGYW